MFTHSPSSPPVPTTLTTVIAMNQLIRRFHFNQLITTAQSRLGRVRHNKEKKSTCWAIKQRLLNYPLKLAYSYSEQSKLRIHRRELNSPLFRFNSDRLKSVITNVSIFRPRVWADQKLFYFRVIIFYWEMSQVYICLCIGALVSKLLVKRVFNRRPLLSRSSGCF